RHNGLTLGLERLDPSADVLELPIPVERGDAFTKSSVRLQAIPQLMQERSDCAITYAVAKTAEFFRQAASAPTGPQERGILVSLRRGCQGRLQVREEGGIRFGERLPPPAGPADAFERNGGPGARALRPDLCHADPDGAR